MAMACEIREAIEREFEERAEMAPKFAHTAACVSSLTRILEQTLQYEHFILNNRNGVESLLEKVRLLQYSLENSSPKNSKKIISLEDKVINLKNLVENRIRDQLGSRFRISVSYPYPYQLSSSFPRPTYKLTFSSNWLKKVKGQLSFIKQLLMEIEEESGVQDLQPVAGLPEPVAQEESGVQDLQPVAGLPEPVAPSENITMVGLDDNFMKVKHLLVSDSPKGKLKIVSLVGMGGIGKTTLGRGIYKDSLISYHFHIRAWVTVSQYFDVRQTIINLLDSMGKYTTEMYSWSTEQLEEHLYKSLKGRRYLIVMDDVWNSNVWDNLRRLFPNDENASRILLTTRLKNVGVYVNSSPPLHVHFLNEDASWKLFCDKVFGKDSCPHELEEIGKRIVRNCQGLPLAIVVISGLLSKATRTQHYWENVAEHLSSVIIANDEQFMKTLSLSYSVLPYHLKRCFLYMAIFPEDYVIHVSTLMKLWIVDEGLSKPEKSKNFEDLAYEYLLDLVDRNLILVDKQSSIGKIKTCKIHDLIRDLCTREAEKGMLFHITDRSLYDIPMGVDLPCLCIHENTINIFPCDEKKLSSLTVGSLVSFDHDFYHSVGNLNSAQLRVLFMCSLSYSHHSERLWSSSECEFPVLQTLIFNSDKYICSRAVEIWNMPQLRHVQGRLLLVPALLKGGTVLEKLQTLSVVKDFKCYKEVLKRIPNLKKLGVHLTEQYEQQYLYNLVHLHKLEVLKLDAQIGIQLKKFHLPSSLKKLTLKCFHISQENMVIFSLLPNLEVLKLKCLFDGQEWEPMEGEFLELKYLHLETDLKHWRADTILYPKLQRLIIRCCWYLEEIPFCFGEIPTLELIDLDSNRPSLRDSAQKIQDEQLNYGNESFKLTMPPLHDWYYSSLQNINVQLSSISFPLLKWNNENKCLPSFYHEFA